MSTHSPVRLASLVAYDCWALLEHAEIARVAWSGPGGVAMVPVNYRVLDGALWFRVHPDSTLAREAGGQRVVVEVDEVDRATRSGWSVVVAGSAEPIDYLDAPEMVVDMRIWPAQVPGLFVRVDPVEISGRRLFGADDAREGR